jgi:hypothetical protein
MSEEIRLQSVNKGFEGDRHHQLSHLPFRLQFSELFFFRMVACLFATTILRCGLDSLVQQVSSGFIVWRGDCFSTVGLFGLMSRYSYSLANPQHDRNFGRQNSLYLMPILCMLTEVNLRCSLWLLDTSNVPHPLAKLR